MPRRTRKLTLAACLCACLCAGATDLPMFGLAGPVETLTVLYSSQEGQWDTMYSFDDQGRLTQVENVPVEVKRDHHGRLERYKDEEEDEDGDIQTTVTTLAYNDDGTVASTLTDIDGEKFADTYFYENGRLARHLSEAPDEEGEVETFTFTYEYDAKTDEHGNWLTRREISAAGDPPVTQRREIKYRP